MGVAFFEGTLVVLLCKANKKGNLFVFEGALFYRHTHTR